jgi:enoyl-CoA hydratase
VSEAALGIGVRTRDGITDVVIDFPPVNALPAQGWYDLAAAIAAAGADPGTRVVILSAQGRGFCAGVDIKEMQRLGGHEGILRASQGCYTAFGAVYECPVPVIAAVHGFCLGGGIGLAANADVIVAADDATFGLPEVDRGALGAATHLARLVPQPLMRAMVYTCQTVTARQLHDFGTVLRVVPAAEVKAAADVVAAEIAAKDPLVIRLAKQSLNGIDPVDVKRSYRYEQGFTYELNLAGAGDKARQAFVDGNHEPKGTAPPRPPSRSTATKEDGTQERPEASAGNTDHEPKGTVPSGSRSRLVATTEDGIGGHPEASRENSG